MSSRDLAIAKLLRDLTDTVVRLDARLTAVEDAARPKGPAVLVSLLKGKADAAH